MKGLQTSNLTVAFDLKDLLTLNYRLKCSDFLNNGSWFTDSGLGMLWRKPTRE